MAVGKAGLVSTDDDLNVLVGFEVLIPMVMHHAAEQIEREVHAGPRTDRSAPQHNAFWLVQPGKQLNEGKQGRAAALPGAQPAAEIAGSVPPSPHLHLWKNLEVFTDEQVHQKTETTAPRVLRCN